MIRSVQEEVLGDGPARYYGVYAGQVVDIADPSGKHRVRVSIPGLIDRSAWAYPRTAGGGGPQRGGHIVPALGSDVFVQFLGGDLERPIYEGANWGDPAAGSEMPVDARDAGAEAHKVQALELEDVRLYVDERDGQRSLVIYAKRTGDFIALDFEVGGVHVRATTAILLQAVGAIKLEAAHVEINGRPVLPGSEAL